MKHENLIDPLDYGLTLKDWLQVHYPKVLQEYESLKENLIFENGS